MKTAAVQSSSLSMLFRFVWVGLGWVPVLFVPMHHYFFDSKKKLRSYPSCSGCTWYMLIVQQSSKKLYVLLRSTITTSGSFQCNNTQRTERPFSRSPHTSANGLTRETTNHEKKQGTFRQFRKQKKHLIHGLVARRVSERNEKTRKRGRAKKHPAHARHGVDLAFTTPPPQPTRACHPPTHPSTNPPIHATVPQPASHKQRASAAPSSPN